MTKPKAPNAGVELNKLRTLKLSPEKRSEIARIAAKARWAKAKKAPKVPKEAA